MKKTLLVLLSVIMLFTLTMGIVNVSAQLADSQTKLNGWSADVDGATWRVGGFNHDYYRGIDTNGKFFIENVGGVPCFKGGSNKRLMLNGLTFDFVIENAEGGSLGEGAHYGIGLSRQEFEENVPQIAFVFKMKADGKFAMYLTSSHTIYCGDGAWGAAEGDDVLARLKNSSGEDVSLSLGLGDNIKVEVKYLTAQERAAYGLQNPELDAYTLFVNGNAYYYLSSADNKFYPVNGDTLPTDDYGNYYGYMTLFGNAHGEVISSLPSPWVEGAIAATDLARITFNEISYNEPEIPVDPTDMTEWADRKNGALANVDGTNWTVGGMNMDYYRGTDVDGNFAIDNVSGTNYYKGASDKYVLLDGMSLKFKLQTPTTKVATGAHIGIGLSDAAMENHYPRIGFVFKMLDSGKFGMYLVSNHYVYNGDGVWNQDGSGNNILNNLREKGGQEKVLSLGLNDEIHIQVRYLSAEERTSYGLQNENLGAYVLFVNGYAYYYLSSADNMFYPVNGVTLPANEDGTYGGYLTVFGNSCGELIQILPTPAEINQKAATENVFMRITFSEMVTDGSKSYGVLANAARDGYESETSYEYASIAQGSYKGKTLIVPTAKQFSYALAQNVLLTGFDYELALKSYNNFGENNAKTVLELASSKETSAEKITVTLERTANNELSVYSNLNGEAVKKIAYDFRNTSVVTIGVFSVENSVIVTVNGDIVCKTEQALSSAFEDGKAYLTVKGYNLSEMIEGKKTSDGTAVRKSIVVSLDPVTPEIELAYKAQLTNLPSTVGVTLDNGSKADLDVIWNTAAVNSAAPRTYTVTGKFTDEVKATYFVDEKIENLLTFKVSVQYPEGYEKYSQQVFEKKYSWFDWCNLPQNFIYKYENGVDHFISDGYGASYQYMPVDTKKKDVDGFNVDFTLTCHDKEKGSYVVFGLMPNTQHINQNEPHISIGFSYNGNSTNIIVFSNETWSNGAAEIARFVNVANAEETLGGEAFNFDWSGNTVYNMSFAIVENRIHLYLTVNGVKYELLMANGTPKTVSAERYANGKGYFLIWNEIGYTEMTLKQNYTKYAVGYDKVEDNIVEFGSEHGLSEKTNLYLNDGSVVEGKVTYTGEYNKEKAGTYKLLATVSYDGDEAIGNGTTIWQDVDEVTFEVNVIVKDEERIIRKIELPSAKSVEFGSTPEWQTTIKITVYSAYYDTETEVEAECSFVSENYNRFVAGEYEFTVIPVGNYKFADGVATTVKVTVLPEKQDEPSDTSEGCFGSISFGGLFSVLAVAVIFTKKKRSR